MSTESVNNETLDRDYIDMYSMKDFLITDVLPAFFPDIDPTNLTTGTTGMVAEYLSTITEDVFNAGSSLLSEVFPTRSRMSSSIYANAAIFQLTDMIGDASRCDFLILLAEEDIRKNLQSRAGSEYSYFYIDKDMIFTLGGVGGTPFTLDYDIEIRALYRESKSKWVYSAKYMTEGHKNSISDVRDPYIRMQQYPNGMLVMKVTLRQYSRVVFTESILDNATLNYPVIGVKYTGTLLGFDVRYKEPGEENFSKQLETRVIYSTPLKTPFCYYRMVDESKFELSFTTKDSYFQPKFNSELEITVYTTMGKAGNFEYYDGQEFSISKGEKYNYPNSWLVASRSISGANGGKDRMGKDALKDLTIEGFTTALSLNTENDLQTYFNNYKHRYDNEVLFVKKRNDAVELLFSAFMYIKQGDYIFPTNTLYLDTNIQYLEYKDGGFYNLDPGYLFGYKGIDAYFIPYYFVITGGDGEKYDPEGHYYDADGNPDGTKDISLRELNKKILGGFVEETDHSYWRLLGDDSPMYHLFLSSGLKLENVDPLTQEEVMTKFRDGELTYGFIDSGINSVDFIMDSEKEAEAKKAYIEFFDEYKNKEERPDMTFDEYLFEYTYKDYKAEFDIDNRRTIFNTNVEEFSKGRDFLFVNPFVTTIAKDTGLVSYYQSYVSNSVMMDYQAENSGQTFEQFITYTLHVERDISLERQYVITIRVAPSVPPDDYDDLVSVLYDDANPELFIPSDIGELIPSLSNFDVRKLSANSLRMVLMFTYKDLDVGYIELIPTLIDTNTDQIEFKAVFHTDDFISAANTIRISHICPYCGHEILNSVSVEDHDLNYKCDACDKWFREGIVNIREMDTLELPLIDGIVRLTALFKDPTKETHVTDNPYVQYDASYEGYQWTNIYETVNERVCLMEPLQMMRSSITYKDYYVTGVDALDCEISDLPLLKYSIMAYAKEGPVQDDPFLVEDIQKFQYFMNAFLDNYSVLKEARVYLNGIHIDMKFYNSYGRSTNFDIGEDGRKIDTNNIAIYFDVHVVLGTDTISANDELRTYIKKYIETINEEGSNNLYISNLIRSIENDFSYVHHLRFKQINQYDTSYQAIINRKIQLTDMTKQERRRFVPDILVVNRNNIYLSFYQDS